MASLQSKLEQGETERQSLHYQLTLAQKESRQSTLLLAEKENEWNSIQTCLHSELGGNVYGTVTGLLLGREGGREGEGGREREGGGEREGGEENEGKERERESEWAVTIDGTGSSKCLHLNLVRTLLKGGGIVCTSTVPIAYC